MTGTKLRALTKNSTAALLAAYSAPPIAGPIALLRFMLTAPSAIAWVRSSGATSSGWSVCQVGDVSVCPAPTAKIRASSTHGVTSPATASTARRRAASSMNDCAAIRRRRRSTRSPIAPAGIASRTTGRPAAVWISATSVTEVVSVSISCWAPTVCIQPPTLLTNCAEDISAKALERNGAHADARTFGAASPVASASSAGASIARHYLALGQAARASCEARIRAARTAAPSVSGS